MIEFLEGITEKPLPQRIALFCGSLVLLGFFFLSQLYSPKEVKLEEVQKEYDILYSKVIKEQKLANNLDRYKTEVKDLDVKLQFALQELPDRSEIPELLSSLSSRAKETGLNVVLFKVNAEQFDEFYAKVPVEMSVNGTFHQVATFFDKVAHLPRIVNISDIHLDKPVKSKGERSLSASFSATTFRYITKEERDSRAKVKGGKRKRKR